MEETLKLTNYGTEFPKKHEIHSAGDANFISTKLY